LCGSEVRALCAQHSRPCADRAGTVSDIKTSGDALVTGDLVCGNEFVHGELVKILRK